MRIQQVLFDSSVLPARKIHIFDMQSPKWRMAQVGDQLDRGDNEIQILYFLERLQKEAEEAGGKLHVLNGNHETMNVAGRFTYATLPALASFYEWQAMHSWGANLKVSILDIHATPSHKHWKLLYLSKGALPLPLLCLLGKHENDFGQSG